MDYSVSMRQDGVVVVTDPEVMTIVVATQIPDAIEQYAKKLRHKAQPVLLLVDARPLQEVEAKVHGIMVQKTLNMDFDRMAVFGTSPIQAKAVNLMLIAGNLIKKEWPISKIKLFATQAAAEQWLKDYRQD